MKHSLPIKQSRAALLMLAVLAATTHADDKAVKLPAKEEFHLFLLAGQSNMAGRGKVI